MRTVTSPPRSSSIDRLVRCVRLSFFISLFSLRDFPGFFPEGLCGDLSGMVTLQSFVMQSASVGELLNAATSSFRGTVANPIDESPIP